MLRKAMVAALVLGLAAVAGFSRGALDRLDAAYDEQELIYLPNGKYLKILSIGHSNVVADLIYLWAIQYYSNYERKYRKQYIEHVFSEVITELDPHYVDAYWLGALILIVEGRDLDAGLRLLEKGAALNPDNWILPYLAAWEAYHAKRYEQAGQLFDQASNVPGAPTMVRRMRAGMMTKAGNMKQALQVWQEILEDPESDGLSLIIAERKLRELRMRLDARALQSVVNRFRDDNDEFPRTLARLHADGYIREMPLAADGRSYRYDAQTGEVLPPLSRILGEH